MNVQTDRVVVRSRWAKNVITFLMIAGPGLIVMEADNDAGAVSTYIQAGAQYGLHLLWILFLLLPITYFVQEMVVRVAAAGVVMIPNAPLQLIIVSVQVLAGLMLPSAIIFLQLLLNDKALLGEKRVNKPWNNRINWTIINVLFALSLLLAVQVVLHNWFPQ